MNQKIKGAIFDVDDTLLDNRNANKQVGQGLHERSRLQAVHDVGRKHGIRSMAEFDAEQNYIAFTSAPVHTIEGAVWNILTMAGLADGQTMNLNDPLLKEIVNLKEKYHEKLLREEGEPLPGAVAFVRAMYTVTNGKIAVASTATRRDITIFFEKTGLNKLFPEERIICKEKLTHPKPHPEAFEKAFASLGLGEEDKANTLAFEDDPRGIMSAKAAGLYTCAIAGRFSRQELQRLTVAPDLVAASYAEFAQILGVTLA